MAKQAVIPCMLYDMVLDRKKHHLNDPHCDVLTECCI